jgi:hypothetical protein
MISQNLIFILDRINNGLDMYGAKDASSLPDRSDQERQLNDDISRMCYSQNESESGSIY